MNLDIKYIHFWIKQTNMETLEKLLEIYLTRDFRIWLLLLTEKLNRIEELQ